MEPTSVQQVVPLSSAETLAWLLTMAASIFGGAAGYKKWGCAAQAPTNGKISQLETVIERFVQEQAVFATEVRGAHDRHARALEGLTAALLEQTRSLQDIGKGITVLLERTSHGPVRLGCEPNS